MIFLISISVFIVVGLILSYLLGCFIDHYTHNDNLKIAVAIIAGVVSLLIIYILYKMVTDPVICDPVHVPNNTVCDPVHKPTQNAHNLNGLNKLQIDNSVVKNSFQECLKNLKL
ncbi:MAG: hypothetical protein Q8N08_05560 [Methanobacteriaceae archaeon]|nr:hypothetical protein [Methanobacteriaceae archaeon]